MIIRIVKMTFKPENTQAFEALFDAKKEKIANFPGCLQLQFLKDIQANSTIYFTYSHWENEAALEEYRASDLFKDVWRQTKVLFAEKAAAWSVAQQFSSMTNN
jgi:quinol monooxygenase YgiN